MKKKIKQSSSYEEVTIGILRTHPKGFGFVIPEDSSRHSQDIFIPKHLIDNAVDGDTVEVIVNPDSNWDKGPEGKIVTILKRARAHLAGTVREVSAQGDWVVYVPILGLSKRVIVRTSSDITLKLGDRIIMKVIEWGGEKEPTLCEYNHTLGHISDSTCDVPAALEEFDLRNAFPKGTLTQAKAYGKKVSAKDLKKRVDLTQLECFTIDPDTAKDFDDALTLTKDRQGNYHLGVHIADVAHYVKPGTPLDKEAVIRANSTYFPGTCIPMLPEALSNELCSLRPEEIRLTISVLMDFDKTGHLLRHEVVRAYIRSAKRFTYCEAKEVLDKKKKSPHAKALKYMVELCTLLKKKRHERGSIDFSLPETVIVIDEKGMPTGVKKIEYDITHQLVEEFMLKANEVVAKELHDRGKSLIFRVHEEPTKENFEDFCQFARSLGFSLSQKPSDTDLQTLFDQAKNTPFSQQLSVAFIRSMKLAQYSPQNIGHFGLALEHYCHFTSPIRRYSDLIVQRLLFNEEPEDLDLTQIALKCSEQERVSFRAESAVKMLKKLRLLQHYLTEDPRKKYEAVITRVKPFGLYFELSELSLEGFLHISELENDYFFFDNQRQILLGKTTGIRHFLGEKITVCLTRVDLIIQESRWALHLAKKNRRKKQTTNTPNTQKRSK